MKFHYNLLCLNNDNKKMQKKLGLWMIRNTSLQHNYM